MYEIGLDIVGRTCESSLISDLPQLAMACMSFAVLLPRRWHVLSTESKLKKLRAKLLDFSIGCLESSQAAANMLGSPIFWGSRRLYIRRDFRQPRAQSHHNHQPAMIKQVMGRKLGQAFTCSWTIDNRKTVHAISCVHKIYQPVPTRSLNPERLYPLRWVNIWWWLKPNCFHDEFGVIVFAAETPRGSS